MTIHFFFEVDMPFEITPIFLVLAAVIGLLIGLLVANLFSTKESKSTDVMEPPTEMTNEGFAEAARLWYSPGVKRVIVELDGAFYRDFASLTKEQQHRIENLLNKTTVWSGVSTFEREPIPETHPTNTPSEQEALPPHAPILDWSVAEAIKAGGQGGEALLKEGQKPRTIAGQISLILEKMLEGNPLREKGITLIENDHHGVDVWVGLEKFDGIDAIPYPEVQQLIRQAALQWERESEASRNKA